MSSIKKILDKHKNIQGAQQPQQTQQPTIPGPSPQPQQAEPQFKPQTSSSEAVQLQPTQLEVTCIETEQLAAANNLPTFETTARFFPGSYETLEASRCSFGFFLCPYPDVSAVQAETRSDKIPRCVNCRTFMNLYNKFLKEGNSYVCSFCNKTNFLNQEYVTRMSENGNEPELSSSCYTVFQPDNLTSGPPLASCFVFLIDVSNSAMTSQMLFYAVSAIKEILARSEFDEHVVFLFTYDESLHYYDLEGSEPTRTIVDKNIEDIQMANNPPDLSSVRQQFFAVLDSLEETAKTNPAAKSGFFQSFNYVFECTKNFSPKMFIFQANENFVTEEMAIEKPPQQSDPNAPKKSALDAVNKGFFNKYIYKLLELSISISFFCFSKNNKNLKVLSDSFKLTNSQLLLYLKDSKQQALKFYYDLYHLLSAPYLSQFKLDISLTPGWVINGTYSNMYRSKEAFNCKINNLQDKKRIAFHILILPNYLLQPTLNVQTVCSYSEQRVRKTTITTYMIPVTKSLYHMLQGINFTIASGLVYRIYLSSMRMEQSVIVRNKLVRATAMLFATLKSLYKSLAQFPPEAIVFFQGILSFLKSHHSHAQTFNTTMQMERIICERNLLQCTSCDQLVTFFTPYLFNLSNMKAQHCTFQQYGFCYPQSSQLNFASIGSGIFLMDCTTHIYIYISKNFNPAELHELFGVDRMAKDTVLTEQNISARGSQLSEKVMALIGQIRQRKYFQYIPLYVVKCGEGSATQLKFYLNFTNEKYEEFRNLNMNFKEFISMLETQV